MNWQDRMAEWQEWAGDLVSNSNPLNGVRSASQIAQPLYPSDILAVLPGPVVLTVLLSAGIKRDTESGHWTMNDLDQPTRGGVACGGLWRIWAAALIYKYYNTTIMPTSQRWHLDPDENKPDHWRVQADLLRESGVPEMRIWPERFSIDTVTELAELLLITATLPVRDHGKRIAVLTNRYHVPRVRLMLTALLQYALGDIHRWFDRKHREMIERLLDRPHQCYRSHFLDLATNIGERVVELQVGYKIVATEDVLGAKGHPDHEEYRDRERAANKMAHLAEILQSEENGIRQLLDGTYGQIG